MSPDVQQAGQAAHGHQRLQRSYKGRLPGRRPGGGGRAAAAAPHVLDALQPQLQRVVQPR